MIIATGYLQVQLFTAEQALPIKGGTIRVFKSEENEVVFEDYFMSDEEEKQLGSPCMHRARKCRLMKQIANVLMKPIT